MEILETSSSYIIALGKTLLNSLWLGILLLSLLKAFFLLIPQHLAVFRYRIALFSMLLFAVLNFTLFFHLYTPVPEGLASITDDGSVGTLLSGVKHLYHYISLAYLSGVGIYLVKILTEHGRLRRLRHRAKNVDGSWRLQFEILCERAGVNMKIDFLAIEGLASPFLTGIVKPAIIVPSAMFTQLSFKEIEAILMHELYHFKRYDHWMSLIQNVLELLFFFNPAIRILSAMISSEREKCCDDRVLEGHSLPLDYARALYLISNLQKSAGPGLTAATGNGRGQLKSRIERILKPNTMKMNIREKSNAFLVFLVGIATMLLVSGFTSGLSITRHMDVPESRQENPAVPVVPADTLTKKEKEQIRVEIEEAMADVDWEEIKKDIEEAKINVLEEIDWEEIKTDIENAKITVLEEIDWDEITKDIEEAKRTIEVEIDWEEIQKEVDEVKVKIDLILDDLDLDMDIEIETETDINTDSHEEGDLEYK